MSKLIDKVFNDKMSCFEKIEFGKEDIVRSALVKSYIISKLELGYV